MKQIKLQLEKNYITPDDYELQIANIKKQRRWKRQIKSKLIVKVNKDDKDAEEPTGPEDAVSICGNSEQTFVK